MFIDTGELVSPVPLYMKGMKAMTNNFISGETRYRVYNKCKFDIGVRLINGVELNIKSNSFQLLTVNDILFIESICSNKKMFSTKMLVPVDETGNEIDIESIGLYKEENGFVHMSDEEIEAALKLPYKKFDAWFSGITDREEIFAIKKIAEQHEDLPTNKMKLIEAAGDSCGKLEQ